MVVNTRSLNNTILGKAYILVFVILICFAGLAHADPVSEIRECNRTNKRDICTKALQHIDELIKSQRATNKQKASAYANRAKILSNAFGQHKKAITDYTRAIALGSSNSVSYFNRGNTYARLKKYELAIEDYNKAIEINPLHISSYGSRGWTYHLLGKNDLALRDYNHILGEHPDDVRALLNRAAIYESLNRKSDAVKDLKKAYETQPGNPHAASKLKALGEGQWLSLEGVMAKHRKEVKDSIGRNEEKYMLSVRSSLRHLEYSKVHQLLSRPCKKKA